mgnify:CR=1 FL=1
MRAVLLAAVLLGCAAAAADPEIPLAGHLREMCECALPCTINGRSVCLHLPTSGGCGNPSPLQCSTERDRQAKERAAIALRTACKRICGVIISANAKADPYTSHLNALVDCYERCEKEL